MDHIRSYKYTNHPIFENNSSLTPPEQRMFDRIIKHEDTWLKQFKDMLKVDSQDKKNRFMEHYNVIKFTNVESDKMLSILSELSTHEPFIKWFETYKDELPEEFIDLLGTIIDLKGLGF